jgi:drug/metabolite transporter (DMT)-like permease
MIGILLTGGSSLAEEAGASIGKWETLRGEESVFSMGFLDSLWTTLFLLVFAFVIPKDFFASGFPHGFVFSMASLPTFLPRVGLEILQAYATVYAIARADRSTFGFLRAITIPLLLVTDIVLAYSVSLHQIAGMSLIIASLILLFINHGIRREGAWLVVFTAVNAVATATLFKYDITHFNSVEAEQVLVSLVLLAFFFIMALTRAKENPLRLLVRPVFFTQSLLAGIGGVFISFAFLFNTASVIMTAKRAFTILFSMLSGHVYFREKELWIKVVCFILIAIGLVFLAV